MEERKEFRSEHLPKQLINEARLNQNHPEYPQKNRLFSFKSCKNAALLGLAICTSTIGMSLAYPQKEALATSTKVLNNTSSESYQDSLTGQRRFKGKNNFLALMQKPLVVLARNHNLDNLKLSKLSLAVIGKKLNSRKPATAIPQSTVLVSSNQEILSSVSPAQTALIAKTNPTDQFSFSKQGMNELQSTQEFLFQLPSLAESEAQIVETNQLTVKKAINQIYTVKPGDTLNKIARYHGISRQQLIEENEIQNPDLIFAAQQIQIPKIEDASSSLPTEETLDSKFLFPVGITSKVAQNHDRLTPLKDDGNNPHISRLRENIVKLREQYSQKERDGQINAPVKVAKPQEQNFLPQLSELDNPQSNTLPKEDDFIGKASNGMENYENYKDSITIPLGASIMPELPPLSSPEQYLPQSPTEFEGYIWPAKGKLTSGYGWRWGRLHRGIDIAAPIGTPIVATASGEVISAGWNSGGYGNLVKVKHADGNVSFYAHNHRILVRRGQRVEQGQQIAQMGSTGYSTGPHLHFEIRSNGKKAVNPVAYLRKK